MIYYCAHNLQPASAAPGQAVAVDTGSLWRRLSLRIVSSRSGASQPASQPASHAMTRPREWREKRLETAQCVLNIICQTMLFTQRVVCSGSLLCLCQLLAGTVTAVHSSPEGSRERIKVGGYTSYCMDHIVSERDHARMAETEYTGNCMRYFRRVTAAHEGAFNSPRSFCLVVEVVASLLYVWSVLIFSVLKYKRFVVSMCTGLLLRHSLVTGLLCAPVVLFCLWLLCVLCHCVRWVSGNLGTSERPVSPLDRRGRRRLALRYQRWEKRTRRAAKQQAQKETPRGILALVWQLLTLECWKCLTLVVALAACQLLPLWKLCVVIMTFTLTCRGYGNAYCCRRMTSCRTVAKVTRQTPPTSDDGKTRVGPAQFMLLCFFVHRLWNGSGAAAYALLCYYSGLHCPSPQLCRLATIFLVLFCQPDGVQWYRSAVWCLFAWYEPLFPPKVDTAALLRDIRAYCTWGGCFPRHHGPGAGDILAQRLARARVKGVWTKSQEKDLDALESKYAVPAAEAVDEAHDIEALLKDLEAYRSQHGEYPKRTSTHEGFQLAKLRNNALQRWPLSAAQRKALNATTDSSAVLECQRRGREFCKRRSALDQASRRRDGGGGSKAGSSADCASQGRDRADRSEQARDLSHCADSVQSSQKAGTEYVKELHDFVRQYGGPPRETPGHTGYELARRIRKARTRKRFTAAEIKEIDKLNVEKERGSGTASVGKDAKLPLSTEDTRTSPPCGHENVPSKGRSVDWPSRRQGGRGGLRKNSGAALQGQGGGTGSLGGRRNSKAESSGSASVGQGTKLPLSTQDTRTSPQCGHENVPSKGRSVDWPSRRQGGRGGLRMTSGAVPQGQGGGTDSLSGRGESEAASMTAREKQRGERADLSDQLRGKSPAKITLSLPALNIQWPWSQLVLEGAKTEEVREYDLGHRKIQLASVETFIVETLGPSANASRNAVIDGAHIGPRPTASQIVGTISFLHSEEYADAAAFRADVEKHRIRGGGQKDWEGQGRRFKWHIASVRRFVCPIPCKTGQTGWIQPRSFDVAVAADEDGARARGSGGPESAPEPWRDARVEKAEASNAQPPLKKPRKNNDESPSGTAATVARPRAAIGESPAARLPAATAAPSRGCSIPEDRRATDNR